FLHVFILKVPEVLSTVGPNYSKSHSCPLDAEVVQPSLSSCPSLVSSRLVSSRLFTRLVSSRMCMCVCVCVSSLHSSRLAPALFFSSLHSSPHLHLSLALCNVHTHTHTPVTVHIHTHSHRHTCTLMFAVTLS